MEWNFIDRGTSTFFRLMLQAKRVYGDGSVWTRHNYRELLHTSGSGGKLQAETLCDAARVTGSATYPLYIFYNTAHTCELARSSGNALISGINLADGFIIERLVKAATTRALRTSNKSLRVIAPYLAPLFALFCPSTIKPVSIMGFHPSTALPPMYLGISEGRPVMGFPMPPTPIEVRNRIRALRAATSPGSSGDAAKEGSSLPDVPEVSNNIPYELQVALERLEAGAGPVGGLNRWRVTFVSNSPAPSDSDRGP